MSQDEGKAPPAGVAPVTQGKPCKKLEGLNHGVAAPVAAWRPTAADREPRASAAAWSLFSSSPAWWLPVSSGIGDCIRFSIAAQQPSPKLQTIPMYLAHNSVGQQCGLGILLVFTVLTHTSVVT